MPVAWRVRNFFLHRERDLSNSLNELFNAPLLCNFLVDLDWHCHVNLDLGGRWHLDSLVEFDLCRHVLRDLFCHFRRHFDLSVYLNNDRHVHLTLVLHYYWHSLCVVFEVLDGFEDFSRHLNHLRSLLNSRNCIFFRYLVLLEHLYVFVADLRRALANGEGTAAVSGADTAALGDVTGALGNGDKLLGHALLH